MALVAAVAAAPPHTCTAADGTAAPSQRGAWQGEFFAGIPRIQFEGPDSTNPLAFRYYNASEEILGKPMREWLRFSLAFWHTMRADGSDMFGSPTQRRPWEADAAEVGELEVAFRRMRAFFELLDKLGVDYWCFHDRDIAPEGASLAETNARLEQVVALAQELQAASGKRVLWGTAQLFKHPRYLHGAATSPNATVFAYAAAQVKKAMEVTKKLNGQGYVFWGGREGYSTLLNTDLALEQANLARFLRMAAAYKRRLKFRGQLLLEPKPQEPTKHQYDFDAATAIAFLLKNGLDKDFKLNIECNHATLAGHSCQHELETAAAYGALGSLDANTGDPQTGWDTDQFMTDERETTLLWWTLLHHGGIAPGGLNFDAKLRRESTDLKDIFYAHISGMDAMARGLRNAARLVQDGVLDGMRRQRYSSWSNSQLGRAITAGKLGFEELEKLALAEPDPWDTGLPSGSAELSEIVLSRYVR
ncbi:xylose isomerase [Chlorella sorokiniana]|uniref:Xylose isomerase n=1 Tax=Chlorella sorokiniana TaxID=3076 RepID=A0A2P6TLE8_CHLSO|nr:xylose isomerase [Chlorella sorokiniana]|eukprot:PRW45113.1 xylose isomerase [Chlorella sorokiniana]